MNAGMDGSTWCGSYPQRSNLLRTLRASWQHQRHGHQFRCSKRNSASCGCRFRSRSKSVRKFAPWLSRPVCIRPGFARSAACRGRVRYCCDWQKPNSVIPRRTVLRCFRRDPMIDNAACVSLCRGGQDNVAIESKN